MSRFLYYIIYALCYFLAVLPFRLLYLLSDLVYFILYYIIAYRKKLARKNLKNAFPYKSTKEILSIEKAFYHHFCDYFFETIKLLNMSESQMKKRFVFKNEEIIQSFLNQGKPVILLLGHFGNWEWVTSITLWIKQDNDLVIGQIYRPLRNKVSDELFIRIRKSFHSVGFKKYDVYKDIIRMRKEGKNWLLGFMSDQKPSGKYPHIWVRFLNQDTPVLTGTEKIACYTGAAVCYLDIKKTKRSFYEGNIELISENPNETQECEITKKYMQLLENTILRDPSGYLWTHNRWKYGKMKNEE